MQFGMSAPKILPTCFHQDAKRKHKSLRNWIIVPWIMEQLHICASFLLPSGGTGLLCAAAQPLSCPWVMRTPLLCNCTLGTTIHTEAGRTWTLQGKLSHSQSCGKHKTFLISSLMLQDHSHWTEPPPRTESWLQTPGQHPVPTPHEVTKVGLAV